MVWLLLIILWYVCSMWATLLLRWRKKEAKSKQFDDKVTSEWQCFTNSNWESDSPDKRGNNKYINTHTAASKATSDIIMSSNWMKSSCHSLSAIIFVLSNQLLVSLLYLLFLSLVYYLLSGGLFLFPTMLLEFPKGELCDWPQSVLFLVPQWSLQ